MDFVMRVQEREGLQKLKLTRRSSAYETDWGLQLPFGPRKLSLLHMVTPSRQRNVK